MPKQIILHRHKSLVFPYPYKVIQLCKIIMMCKTEIVPLKDDFLNFDSFYFHVKNECE